MKLTLPNNPRQFASWNNTLHRMLADSGLFDVQHSDDLPQLPRGSCGRVTKNMSVFAVDDELIALDTWDTDSPTDTAWQLGLFGEGKFGAKAPLADVTTVLKIQWMPKPKWDEMQQAGLRVMPWTIFPSQEFPLGAFQWQPTGHEYTALVTGANRYGRPPWQAYARDRADWFTDAKRSVPMEDLIGMLRVTRWGLSLGGKRGTDRKNRREIEFASCGMPLVLNYQPHYPFLFEPDVHYVYVDSVEDVDKLYELDPQPFAEASRQLWRDYFSPQGMARTMAKLISTSMSR